MMRSRRSTRNDEVGEEGHDGIPLLVEGRGADPDDAAVGPRLRSTHGEHFTFDMQCVARAYGPRPFELVDAGTDEPTDDLEVAAGKQLHRQCRGVPPTGDEAAEQARASG